MNPELKRNLLIEISAQRLIAMPVILALIFLAIWVTDGAKNVASLSQVFIWLLVFLWGSRKAAGAFDAELVNNTWDGQRLSALTASQIFFGKLFGGTAFVLYGALICLAVTVSVRLHLYLVWLEDPSALPLSVSRWLFRPSDNAWSVADIVLTSLLGLAVAMFVAVVLMSRARSSRGISVTACQVVAIGVAFLIADLIGSNRFGGLFSAMAYYDRYSYADVGWLGIDLPRRPFIIASLLIFLGWALLGAIRQLREILQIRSFRWAWGAFVIFIGVYLAGFDELYGFASAPGDRSFIFLTVMWAAALAATYAAVFFEAKSLQRYRSYAAALGRLQPAGIFQHQPFWLTAFVIVVVVLIFNLAVGTATSIFAGVGADRGLASLFGIVPSAARLKVLMIAGTLFLLRDCLLVLVLNFGRNRRRADLAALIYLAVLYLVVPAVLVGIDLDRSLLLNFFLPRVNTGSINALWPVALEVVVLAGALVMRWRTVRYPVPPEPG